MCVIIYILIFLCLFMDAPSVFNFELYLVLSSRFRFLNSVNPSEQQKLWFESWSKRVKNRERKRETFSIHTLFYPERGLWATFGLLLIVTKGSRKIKLQRLISLSLLVLLHFSSSSISFFCEVLLCLFHVLFCIFKMFYLHGYLYERQREMNL